MSDYAKMGRINFIDFICQYPNTRGSKTLMDEIKNDLENITTILNKQFLDDFQSTMSLLEDVMSRGVFTEGEYLIRANKLKKDYDQCANFYNPNMILKLMNIENKTN